MFNNNSSRISFFVSSLSIVLEKELAIKNLKRAPKLIVLMALLFVVAPLQAAFNCKNEFNDGNYDDVYAESSCFTTCKTYDPSKNGDVNNGPFCVKTNTYALPGKCAEQFDTKDKAYTMSANCLSLCSNTTNYYNYDGSFCDVLAQKCSDDYPDSMDGKCNSDSNNLCSIPYYQVDGAGSYTFCGDRPSNDIDIASSPLFLGAYAEPNIMLLLDDSTSMTYEIMPLIEDDKNTAEEEDDYFPTHLIVYDDLDEIYQTGGATIASSTSPTNLNVYKKTRSYYLNKLYYNPEVDYKPWTGTGGGSFRSEYSNVEAENNAFYYDVGGNVKKSCTGEGCTPAWCLPYNPAVDAAGCAILGTDIIAEYFSYDTSLTGCEPSTSDEDCFSRVLLSSDEDIGNFANWFTYYRSKILSVRAALGHAFGSTDSIPETYRVGFATINTSSTTTGINQTGDSTPTYSYSSDVLVSGVDALSNGEGSYRDIFFGNYLYNYFVGGNNRHLLYAVDAVGDYFDGTVNSSSDAGRSYDEYSPYGPWSDNPGGNRDEYNNPVLDSSGVAVGTALADAKYCRRSYNLLVTDGEWNDSTDSFLHEVADDYYDIGIDASPDSDGDEGLIANLGGSEKKMGAIDVNYDGDLSDYGDDAAEFSHLTQMIVAFGQTTSSTVEAYEYYPGKPLPSSSGDITDKIDDLFYAAAKTGGRFYEKGDYTGLMAGINDAVEVMRAGSGYINTELSGSSVALNSGSLFQGSTLFQALFTATQWSGRINAYPIQTNGTLNKDAVVKSDIDKDSRNIATWACTTSVCDGYAFTYAALSGKKIAASASADDYLDVLSPTTTIDSADIISWMKGTLTDSSGAFRGREEITVDGETKENLLGDIINAAPVYVGQSNGFYEASKVEGFSSYKDFKNAQSCGCADSTCIARCDMVYAGANDGMLHMFKVSYDEDTSLVSAIDEIAAYVPNSAVVGDDDVEGEIEKLATSNNYVHSYFVDSTPTVLDVYFDTGINPDWKNWKTVLVGGLGAGGKGIYALDVTDTSALASSSTLPDKVLWEYRPVGDGTVADTDGNNMGFSFSRPSIIEAPTGERVALFGNGYNSARGDACIYAVNLQTGAKLDRECFGARLVDTTYTPSLATTKNGLSTVTPVDINADGIADWIYAGDLYGNVWRIDLKDSGGFGFVGYSRIFQAGVFTTVSGVTTQTQIQPITTRINVSRHPSAYGGTILYFGTGQYLGESDVTASVTSDMQTFYGIWDRDNDDAEYSNPVKVEDLLQQNILLETFITETEGDDPQAYAYRISTDYDINWFIVDDEADVPIYYPSDTGGNPSKCYYDSGSPSSYTPENVDCAYLGWKMDLYSLDPGVATGEMQVTDSIVNNGKIIFTTTIPDTTVCGSNESGWLMELDAESGARLGFSPFDVDGSNDFDGDYTIYTSTDKDGVKQDLKVAVSGRKSTVGLLPTPGILSDYSKPTEGKEFKYMSGSSGTIEAIQENAAGVDSGKTGRRSWFQLLD